MNRVEIRIGVTNEKGELCRELGRSYFPLTDPGEDIQAIHGWKRHVASRLGLAATAVVADGLSREDVTAATIIEQTGKLPDGGPATMPMTAEGVVRLLMEASEKRFVPVERYTVEMIDGWTGEEREEVAIWAQAVIDGEGIPPVPAVLEAAWKETDDDEMDAGDDAGGSPTPGGEAGSQGEAGQGTEEPAGAEEAGGSGDPEEQARPAGGEGDGPDPEADGGSNAGSTGSKGGRRAGGKVPKPSARRSRRGEDAAT